MKGLVLGWQLEHGALGRQIDRKRVLRHAGLPPGMAAALAAAKEAVYQISMARMDPPGRYVVFPAAEPRLDRSGEPFPSGPRLTLFLAATGKSADCRLME